MSDAEHDPVVRRAVEELRQLPPLDRDAVRRVVAAAAAARVTPADEPLLVDAPARGRSIRMWSAIGMAAAAAIVGFVARGEWAPRGNAPNATTVEASQTPGTPALVRPAASSESDSRPILQQFVFDNARARRVSVVGDFNQWNPASAPMTRSSDGGPWSVIIPVFPGRHVYGFMVDDSVFTLDPRQPKVRDADLGTEGSVVIVGRP
jgi:hypothetical protein